MKGIGFLVVTAVLTAGPVADSPADRAAEARYRSSIQAQDPADSVYRVARAEMARGNYTRSAELFGRVVERYPRSAKAGEAMYYQAFSLYRIGGTEKLKAARDVLARLRATHPEVAKRDATTLDTRICGELARQGDEACAAEVANVVSAIARADARATTDARAAERTAEARERQAEIRERETERRERQNGRSTSIPGCPNVSEDDDERIAALNALLQMDAERALPVLATVLARRDPCSPPLRRKAVFLVSQKRSPESADILLRVARNDPDRETREQAVFWLSQVSDERAVDMLQDILRSSSDTELQKKALFALGQHRSGKGAAVLRDFASREDASVEVRADAIFWLGQRGSGATENSEFLRELYGRLRNDELKEKVLFSLSQRRGVGNEKWLMSIVTNERENTELRKKALFWAGQSGIAIEELIPFYDRLSNREMKDQMIFVLSQRKSGPAVDKLLDIAKNDRDPELRKKAIFWLGQSRDPRAQQFLLELINR